MTLNIPDLSTLEPLQRDVLGALALGAASRPRTWVMHLLADPALREPDSKRPTNDFIREALRGLQAAGLVSDDERRPGFWRPAAGVAGAAYLHLLQAVPKERLHSALAHAEAKGSSASARIGRWTYWTTEAAVAGVRLEAYSGASPEELQAFAVHLPWGVDGIEALFEAAVLDIVDEALLPRLHPALQSQVLNLGLVHLCQTWRSTLALPLVDRVAERLQARPVPFEPVLRPLYAEYLMIAGRAAEVAAVVAPMQERGNEQQGAMAQAVTAAAASWQGRWAEAESGMDTALAALRKLTGKRRGLVSHGVGAAYVLSLLAQQSPAHLAKALKFCLGEGGKREPVLDSGYGYMALAIQMRLGDARRDLLPFRPYLQPQFISQLDPWRWMMRAWLKEGALPEPLSEPEQQAAERLCGVLQQAGLAGLQQQVQAALQVLAGEPAPPGFFVPAGLERWQVALAALQAVAQPADAAAPARAAGPQETRLLWLLELGARGNVESLVPLEQKRGPRGWGKPKEVPLSRLQRTAEALPPHDAAVARTIKQESYGRAVRLDLAAAVAALVGHPAVALDGAPDTLVELVEAGPELDVVHVGEMLHVRMLPSLQVANDDAVPRWASSAAEQKEQEALRLVTVIRESPQRARLIRLTPAQKRVAQLLGPKGLEIPQRGAAQLQEVLSGLGVHFRIHADDAQTAQAARELPAEPRLRAELSPVGDGLQLRLVAAPFGADYAAEGPRLIPGSGRARMVATLRGESLGVHRDLAREREHLATVLDACPMLFEPAPGAPCEWQLDDPEDALALVERLRPLNALAALDWPQGKSVRVDTGALGQLALRVHTKQEWLAVQGELQVDEALVMSLQQLIAFAGSSKSRFMPLGEGRYLALTQELRTRLDEIAAVAEVQRAAQADGLRVPVLAAAWLAETAEGAQFSHDAAFGQRLQRLEQAHQVVPALPATLQAQLRPYQEEGFEWAMRLAYAGLGACLADDMGLGKTLQALGVLLSRAPTGPALVVAPTSLLGNWRAEARRFAPSLRMHLYAEGGEGGRAGVIERAGAHDVVLVSYQMLQSAGAAFAAKPWHTLVLDEAQAIKNAAAKRSQAVFELRADFRMALSGTPIENRLAELWSIMRACNPGLLGTLAQFNERFAGLIERQKDRQAQRTLRRLIGPFILRRTKAQVLDELPPRTELVLQVEPEAAEQAHYEALRRDTLIAAQKSLSGDGAGQAHLNILAGLTRLRRAACDPRLTTPGIGLVGAKVQAFGELAAELVANGHKALVFSQFVDFLQLLREPLDAAGIPYQYLDGSTPGPERTRRVDAFQAGQGDLFLISLKAGGFGLNLTVADYVVIADPWWNPAAEDQASGRAHRIGQQRPVTVYRLVSKGTLEERILTLHQDKRELADRLLEGSETASLPPAEELLALMQGAVADEA